MKDAYDLVRSPLIDGDAGVTFLIDQPDQFRHRGLQVGANHLRRRGHHLGSDGLPKIKNRIDQPLLVNGDQALLLALLQQFLDFMLQFLGGVRHTTGTRGADLPFQKAAYQGAPLQKAPNRRQRSQFPYKNRLSLCLKKKTNAMKVG